MGFDVSLPQDRLEQLLRAAGRAASGRAPQPVLQGLLLAGDGDRLSATGYDLSLGVRSETLATVAQAGAVVAPYRMLSALVAALPEGSMVRLASDGTGALAIAAGEGRYSVALTHEPEDFPTLPLPTLGDVEPIGLPYGTIKRALNAVAFCVSTEESKQILCGVQFSIEGRDLRVSGIDGNRGSFYDLPGIIETGKDSSFVVPAGAVKEVLKLGLADDDLLLVVHTEAFSAFEAGDTTIFTNLLAGAYPPFFQLLSETCKTQIIGDRQGLISAVERAAIVANAETGGVSLAFDARTGDISISAINDSGSAADLVPTQSGSTGQDFTLTLNSRYALDALRHVESELVSIAFNDVRLIQFSPVGSSLHRQLVASISKPTA